MAGSFVLSAIFIYIFFVKALSDYKIAVNKVGLLRFLR